MEQIHIDRLKAVLKANEGRDPSGFDMSYVLWPPSDEACGAAGCLLGAYILRPDLQSAFRAREGGSGGSRVLFEGNDVWFDNAHVVDYFGLTREEFAVVFLHDGTDVDAEDDEPLYGDGERWTLEEKLAQVRAFIAEKEAER